MKIYLVLIQDEWNNLQFMDMYKDLDDVYFTKKIKELKNDKK